MASIAKAKTAKLVRDLLGFFSAIPNSTEVQINVTKENIEWAKNEKRIFLKQNLETRLISLCVYFHYLFAGKILTIWNALFVDTTKSRATRKRSTLSIPFLEN